MCRTQFVVVLITLYFVGITHSWDIAVSVGGDLEFYTNGTNTKTVKLSSQNLAALAYDDFHNTMFYVDKQSDHDAICGYNIYSNDTRCFVSRYGGNIYGIAFDPVTGYLFFTDTNERSIYWVSLKRGSINNIHGNLLINMDDRTPRDIAVNSCKGYIYWTNTNLSNEKITRIERAKFDGSERREIYGYGTFDVFSLAVDPQTRKVYYFDGKNNQIPKEEYYSSCNLYGQNEGVMLSFHGHQSVTKVMTVSKDYVYWMNSSESYKTVWQFPKIMNNNTSVVKEICNFHNDRSFGLAANYKIKEKIAGIRDCDALTRLIAKPTSKTVYTDKRSEGSACENYCLHGNCSLNGDGLPKCSCNVGFSGERCEVYACHGYCWNNGDCSLNGNGEPVCQCRGDYVGDRCEVSDCLNYCMQGNCSYNDEGLPTCRCSSGYSGDRCEVYACHGYCWNNGTCSLNENSKPVCECRGDYVGDRCEVADCLNYCVQGICSFNDERLPTCSCDVGYTGDRCEVNVCLGYCLNNGDCTLNEKDEPVCECDGDHEGSRCEAVKYIILPFTNNPTYYSEERNRALIDSLLKSRKPNGRTFITVEV